MIIIKKKTVEIKNIVNVNKKQQQQQQTRKKRKQKKR